MKINWDLAPEWAMWFGIEEDGTCMYFEFEPELEESLEESLEDSEYDTFYAFFWVLVKGKYQECLDENANQIKDIWKLSRNGEIKRS